MMQFSVIIPTRNRPEALAACLHSFCQLEYPAGAWELIAVNDGGEDSFTAVSTHLKNVLPLKLIDAPQAGPAAARNRGAAVAQFDTLAFTDDDCRVMPDWLHQFATGFAQTSCDALGGSWRNPQPDKLAMRAAHFLVEFMYDYMQDASQNSLMLLSNNVAYWRAAFTAVGGFDETFPLAAGEDMELGFRLVAQGWSQGYWPEAQVWHDHNLSNWGHVQQQFRYGRGGHFFLQAIAKQARNGHVIQPSTARNFYLALAESVRQQEEPWSFAALVAFAQAAYRFGQFYQRQASRLATILFS
ncbi:glycosyltransferase [Candidatus Leptofilum sp.]|uniref:glycosyltransferase n=1 Tax=Candidatus Leptofilum sp. TaxID=3241576 RepID=UPI003B592660